MIYEQASCVTWCPASPSGCIPFLYLLPVKDRGVRQQLAALSIKLYFFHKPPPTRLYGTALTCFCPFLPFKLFNEFLPRLHMWLNSVFNHNSVGSTSVWTKWGLCPLQVFQERLPEKAFCLVINLQRWGFSLAPFPPGFKICPDGSDHSEWPHVMESQLPALNLPVKTKCLIVSVDHLTLGHLVCNSM